MSLAELRAALDEVDAELIAVLARRAALVREIWAWKAAHGLPRFDPERERALRDRLVRQGVELGLSAESIEAILAQVIGKAL